MTLIILNNGKTFKNVAWTGGTTFQTHSYLLNNQQVESFFKLVEFFFICEKNMWYQVTGLPLEFCWRIGDMYNRAMLNAWATIRATL